MNLTMTIENYSADGVSARMCFKLISLGRSKSVNGASVVLNQSYNTETWYAFISQISIERPLRLFGANRVLIILIWLNSKTNADSDAKIS